MPAWTAPAAMAARPASSWLVTAARPLADDERSLAYRLTFRAGDVALADAELDAAVGAITAGLAADVGARIRT